MDRTGPPDPNWGPALLELAFRQGKVLYSGAKPGPLLCTVGPLLQMVTGAIMQQQQLQEAPQILVSWQQGYTMGREEVEQIMLRRNLGM